MEGCATHRCRGGHLIESRACSFYTVRWRDGEVNVDIIVIESYLCLQVASEHVPAERNDYVTIAYVPLKGEH